MADMRETTDLMSYLREHTGKSVSPDTAMIYLGLSKVAYALHRLGLSDAATPMGALEAHGLLIKETFGPAVSDIANGLGDIAESLDGVAQALKERT